MGTSCCRILIYLNSSFMFAVSVFQVVRFHNSPCSGGGGGSSLNGTCYTEAECSQRGGDTAGGCAQGFGVCCTCEKYIPTKRLPLLNLNCKVRVGCGGSSSENCTYFSSGGGGVGAGSCVARICPRSTDICQVNINSLFLKKIEERISCCLKSFCTETWYGRS